MREQRLRTESMEPMYKLLTAHLSEDMFGSFGSTANAYARVGVETGVADASPHKLIGMLYDGLIETIGTARHAMAGQETARKGEALSKAIRILEEGLRASLDREQGASLAMQLDSLYEYMITRLLQANLRNDIAALEEVSRLVSEIRDAWYAMPALEAA